MKILLLLLLIPVCSCTEKQVKSEGSADSLKADSEVVETFIVADDNDTLDYKGVSPDVLETISSLTTFYDRYGTTTSHSLDVTVRAFEKDLTILTNMAIGDIERYIKHASGGSTADMILAGNTQVALTFYRTIKEYAEILQIEKGQSLCGLIADEYEKWNRMADVVRSIGADIIDLTYYGGSILGPLHTSLSAFVAEVGYYNVHVLKCCLIEDYDSLKKGMPAEAANIALQKTIDVEVRDHYDTEYMEEDVLESYNAIYKDVCSKRDRIAPLINDWIKVHMAISEEVDTDGHKLYKDTIGVLLTDLATAISQ